MTEISEPPPPHFLLDRYDPGEEEYQAASDEELELLRSEAPRDLEYLVNDPASKIDNRTAVRFVLALRSVSGDMFRRLVRPYDIGFYKKSDGKSHPLWFLRIPRFLRVLGFRKDIVAVRHDFDYYRGRSSDSDTEPDRYDPTERLRADRNYRAGQIAVGLWRWAAWIEYFALRVGGWWSWRNHRRKSEQIDGYGTIGYIPQLPDKY